jgi:D-glycerate 3-kinase
MRLGERLAVQLEFDFGQLDAIQRLRIFHYYLPVFFWVQNQLQQHKAKHKGHATTPPMVLGISAPQGCGKTTIVEQLEQLFTWLSVPTASVSIDDFYLTHADQSALAAAHPDNRLLQLRGNAGTHDLALGRDTLSQLKGLSAAGATAAVPRYDKSAFGGRGDRAPKDSWPVVQGPLQLVLFEGWMLGFKPVGAASAAAVEAALAEVDARLGAYQEAWDSAVDAWLVVRISDPQWVFGWRLQAEQRMRAEGKTGMTDAQIADFVSRYIPAYEAYLPGLYAAGPTTATAGHMLTIEVDKHRAPVAQQPAPVL